MFFDSTSSSNQSQTTAQDTGRIISGKGVRYTESGSFQVGDKARYTESGSIQTGDKSSLLLNSVGTLSATQGSTVNVGLGASDVSSLVGQITQATGSQIQAFQQALADAQQQIGDLATGVQTGGESTSNSSSKFIFWGIVGLFGLLVWRSRP
jgi:hypothetical protein